MGDKRNQLTGHLSNYRCPDCGRSLYVNKVGSAWCSVCDYKDVFNAEELIELQPAEQQQRLDAELRTLIGDDDDPA